MTESRAPTVVSLTSAAALAFASTSSMIFLVSEVATALAVAAPPVLLALALADASPPVEVAVADEVAEACKWKVTGQGVQVTGAFEDSELGGVQQVTGAGVLELGCVASCGILVGAGVLKGGEQKLLLPSAQFMTALHGMTSNHTSTHGAYLKQVASNCRGTAEQVTPHTTARSAVVNSMAGAV